jgi:hypothetical protein
MIAPLRRRHAMIWSVLAVVLPVLIILAWSARRAAPVMEKLPAELQTPASP